MLKKIRPYISIILLISALALATIYLSKNPALIDRFLKTPLILIFGLLGLYLIVFSSLAIKFAASLKVCHFSINSIENAKLTAHMLLINFFIPGQGGPIYLGAYLLKKHKLKVKNYIAATALYYVIYAVLSVFMLLSPSRPWWQVLIAISLTLAVGYYLSKSYIKKAHIQKSALDFSLRTLIILTLATIFQLIIQTVIYGLELHSVLPTVHLSQIITYSGAANLALFVSVTPGGIGVREAFLLFSEKLNHLSSSNIILASLIDRSIYIVFLLIIIFMTSVYHFRLNWQKPKPAKKELMKV